LIKITATRIRVLHVEMIYFDAILKVSVNIGFLNNVPPLLSFFRIIFL
jgi:hypothetical protein